MRAKDLGCPVWLFYLDTLWSTRCHGGNATCLWIYIYRHEASVSEVGGAEDLGNLCGFDSVACGPRDVMITMPHACEQAVSVVHGERI